MFVEGKHFPPSRSIPSSLPLPLARSLTLFHLHHRPIIFFQKSQMSGPKGIKHIFEKSIHTVLDYEHTFLDLFRLFCLPVFLQLICFRCYPVRNKSSLLECLILLLQHVTIEVFIWVLIIESLKTHIIQYFMCL